MSNQNIKEVTTLEPVKREQGLFQMIETLREKLHRQEDFTKHDALKVSVELDRLILEAMKEGHNGL